MVGAPETISSSSSADPSEDRDGAEQESALGDDRDGMVPNPILRN